MNPTAKFVVLITNRFMTDFVTSHMAAVGFSTLQAAQDYVGNGDPARFSQRVVTGAEYDRMTGKDKMQGLPMYARQGGKVYIRKSLVAIFPTAGRIYGEPFAGAGNVFFLARTRLDFKGWWLNDKYSAGFLNAINEADLETLPNEVGKHEFRKLRYSDSPTARLLEPRVTMMGLGYTASINNYRSKGRQYNREPFKQKCIFARELLRGVRITDRHWHDIDYSLFDERDFLYFDPPYFGESSTYGEINHTTLLKMLQGAKFKWAISGYDSELYRDAIGLPGFSITRGGHMTTLARGAKTQITRLESVWTNYSA